MILSLITHTDGRPGGWVSTPYHTNPSISRQLADTDSDMTIGFTLTKSQDHEYIIHTMLIMIYFLTTKYWIAFAVEDFKLELATPGTENFQM